MGHFAKVKNGKVIRVIVADQSFIDNMGVETEPGVWIKCSYNTRGGVHYQSDEVTPSTDQSKSLRKNFPGVNATYDAKRDAFYSPKPRDPFNRSKVFESWVLDDTTCTWEAPVSIPSDAVTVPYRWDEDAYQAALSDSSDTSVAWVQMQDVDTP